MPVAASVSRLFIAFIAFIATVLSTASFADDSKPYNKDRGPYLERCEILQNYLASYRATGRTDNPDDVISTFLNFSIGLDRFQAISGSLDLAAEDATRCNALFAKITSMVTRAQAASQAAHAERDKKSKEAALVIHHNSPEYKRARSLGYDDVGDIGYLSMYENMDGEDKMKSMLFLVDDECGAFFEAIQYSPPYVVYRAESRNCGESQRVAVLGTSDVSAGDLIDKFATYEYVGRKKIVAPNGFSISTRVLKQR